MSRQHRCHTPHFLCIGLVLLFSGSLSLSSPSSFAEQSFSSSIAKKVVFSLTSLSNRLGIDSKSSADDFTYTYKNEMGISDAYLVHSLREDFRRGYLFSGEIDPEIYATDCLFTDPTLSFSGLNTFRRNIANLKPIIEKYIGSCAVLLHGIELKKIEKKVVADWTMYGTINLPWKPIINLQGQTTYTYDDSENGAKGRIIDYYERWQIPAVAALLQLLTPTRQGECVDIPTLPPSSASSTFNVYTVLRDEISKELNDFNRNVYLALLSDSEVQKLREAIEAARFYDLFNSDIIGRQDKSQSLYDGVSSLYIVQGKKIFGYNIVINKKVADSLFQHTSKNILQLL